MVKNLPAMWKTCARSLSWEHPLEERMATHSSILAWRISMDRGAWWAIVQSLQRVGHDWATKHSFPLYGHNILFTQPSADGHLGCPILDIMNIPWTFMCKIFVMEIYFQLCVYLGVELPHVFLCWIFCRTAKLISKAAMPFYIPTGLVWRFQFLYIFIALVVVHLNLRHP